MFWFAPNKLGKLETRTAANKNLYAEKNSSFVQLS